ncbi:MAG: hypothetical protein ABIH67_01395 [Candidatus Uhrbacteria bacterium]
MPTAIDIVQTAFADLWASLLTFLPLFLGAIVVFILGLIIAAVLKGVVVKVSNLLHLDDLAVKLDVKESFKKMGINLDIAGLLGWIVKWFVVVVALIAATDILGWSQLTSYLQEVVLYLPNVIIAVIILLVGVLLANFVNGVVKASVKAAKLHSADFLAGISKWAILIFSFMAAIAQLGIAQNLINILFTGFVAMLALAGGLAFGLGGKEYASSVLSKLKKDIGS